MTVNFLSVAAFKKAIGASSLKVVFNQNSQKLSVLSDEDVFFRCQQSINLKSRVAFLVPDGDLDNACLVNVKEGKSPLETRAELH